MRGNAERLAGQGVPESGIILVDMEESLCTVLGMQNLEEQSITLALVRLKNSLASRYGKIVYKISEAIFSVSLGLRT